MNDTYEELRIIAKDGGHLTLADRGVIARGADEIESLQKYLLKTLGQLQESNNRLIAINERLLEQHRAELAKPKKLVIPGPLSMTLLSGPMRIK